MHFVHLKTSGLLRVLRTRVRIVRSNTWFIHSLLGVRHTHSAYMIISTLVVQRFSPFDTPLADRRLQSHLAG